MEEGLKWTENLTPIDPRFDDKYFAEEGGLDESRYVFLGQNNLPARFQSSERFTIGELGFGTGLNFFSVWQEWEKQRSPTAWLNYVACELNPLTSDDILRTTSVWPELAPYVASFLKSYKPFFPGFHRIVLPEARIALTLLIGDALQSLSKLAPSCDLVNAWFLDGFAPRKNPEMWSEDIFRKVHALSQADATFATFTSAGWVKRNLQAAGFQVEKFAGFGRKREMLKGRRIENKIVQIAKREIKNITIVGAGLAGCFAAHSLSLRGYKIRLIEKESQLTSGASGNPAAVMMPTLTAVPTPASELSIRALRFLVDLLERKDLLTNQAKGVLQVFESGKQEERARRAIEWLKLPSQFAEVVSASKASEISDIKIDSNAIWYPWATAASPKRICETLISNSEIQWNPNTELKSFAKSISGWKCETSQGSFETDILIFANAHGLSTFESMKWIPLRAVRGQVLWTKLPEKMPAVTLSGPCTIAATETGNACIGSTYDRENLDLSIRSEENTKMIGDLNSLFSLDIKTDSILGARARLRATTLRKVPLVSEIDSGLYCDIGMGSRGFLFAPLCGEVLVSLIDGGPSPIEAALLNTLDLQEYRPSN